MEAQVILELIYLYLPAGVANIMPLLCRNVLPRLNMPLDLGMRWMGKRVLGDHKTWKGLFVGAAAGVMTAYLQYAFGPTAMDSIMYSSVWWQWGLLLGLGALLGDAFKSFFKRRMGFKPGASWMPFDQVDYAVGALALGSIIYFPGWLEAVIVLALAVVMHLLVSTIGYYSGWREERW